MGKVVHFEVCKQCLEHAHDRVLLGRHKLSSVQVVLFQPPVGVCTATASDDPL
jgi:hypothetical protein